MSLVKKFIYTFVETVTVFHDKSEKNPVLLPSTWAN